MRLQGDFTVPFDEFGELDSAGSSFGVVKPPVALAAIATVVALASVVFAAIDLEWAAYALAVISSIAAMLTLRVDAKRRPNPNYQHGTPIVGWMRVIRWVDLIVVVVSSVLLALEAAK